MDISKSGLHIINGLSAAASWGQAFHKTDRLLVQEDILSCGPMPQCKTLSEWKEIRTKYLKELFFGDLDIDFDDIECDLLKNADRLKDYDQIFIWAGTGIEDQFLILFVIYLTDLVGTDPSKIKLIQYEKYPDKDFLVRSMGILIPERIRNHPEPKSLTESDIDYFGNAWFAITSSNPAALREFISKDNVSFPYVRQAIQYLMRRYPQLNSGLPYWDWQLIKSAQKHAPSAARIIGYTMGLDFPEDGDHVGDLYLFYRVCELADKPIPLIELHGKQESLRDTTVNLTEFGNAVLNGEASSYPSNPIDEWIGGVHLSSDKGNVWFYNAGNLQNPV